MNLFLFFQDSLQKALANLLSAEELVMVKHLPIQVDLPRNTSFGDLATNAALVLGKFFKKNPLELAESLKRELLAQDGDKNIAEISIVKPGFINFVLTSSLWQKVLNSIIKDKGNFGKQNLGNNKKVNIEYVSANPTGPMHIGHGRGAVVGDVLANLYSYFGYNVVKEYYINDAGNQIKSLAMSLRYRYTELLGKTIAKPEDFYPGEYIIDAAKALQAEVGSGWVNKEDHNTLEAFGNFAVNYMLKIIREDLSTLGINHDIFVSEKAIANEEAYQTLKKDLISKDLVYMGTLEPPKGIDTIPEETSSPEPSLLFKTSQFNDTQDRTIEKVDGTRTYFANDIVYHQYKLNRGFDLLIDLLGADHKGYQKRLEAVVKALSDSKVDLKIVFTELVNLKDNGQNVRMSKRAGNFVTLRSVIDEVGKDAFRIMMLSRSSNSVLDFDLSTLQSKTEENPLYYLSYAYARINSVLNKVKTVFPEISEEQLLQCDKQELVHPLEIELLKYLALYPKLLKSALEHNNVHLLFVLFMGLAQRLHSLWGLGKVDTSMKFILENNLNLTFARVSLLTAVKYLMLELFTITGLAEPQKM